MIQVRTLLLIAPLLICLLSVPGAVRGEEDNIPPPGFEALFNGKDFAGWRGQRDISPYRIAEMSDTELAEMRKADHENLADHWRVEDGEIVNDGHGVFLATEREFRDYELWIDYRTVANADSGIYLKGCPQVQIWDTTEAGGKWNIGADKGSGGLWNNSPGSAGKDPAVLADKPFGEWNRFRIIQVGARTSIWLNGQQVVKNALLENNHWKKGFPIPARGPIWLQTHGGEIRWKNVFVKEYSTAEAMDFLASQDSNGFESVFNGENFEGWQGATEHYQIEDGVIRCEPGHGGNLFTEQEYGDFSVRFQFKLPPAGNNGLLIRYPGQGDGAYAGMCELQVLDSQHQNWAKLDPRQHHGSAYAMVAAHRGYLRETGQWNFQQVDVVGSKIRVELNGTVILEADLNAVTEFMNGDKHTGRNRERGFFGFAGHNDPVEFRQIQIRELSRVE